MYKTGGWGCCALCSGSTNSWPWQMCKCAWNDPSFSCPGREGFAFELMKNKKYVVEQSNAMNLPPECTPPSSAKGDIFCTVEFLLDVGDKLAVTWYEPSHGISAQDTSGPITVDVYCRMEGIFMI